VRLVFLGYQAWGTRALQGLLDSGHEIVLVVTHPASDDAYESLWDESVRALAERHGIPVLERATVNDPETARLLARHEPELFVMSNWRRWLSPDVYRLAPHGAINAHDALLPAYGGFAPINWAVAAGERETGVTVHVVDEGLDTGAIVVQERVPIGFDDTATDVYHRTLPLFPELVAKAVGQLESGTATPVAQDRSAASFFPKRSRRDIAIDWQRTPTEIYNLVRAQSDPYPSAFTLHDGTELEILSARLSTGRDRGTPGQIVNRDDGGVVVRCGGAQALVVQRVRPAGGEALAAGDYFGRLDGRLGAN
jgi:methionyl-tRNA formyltransferase